MLEETGTLRGFLLGECPGAAYDNWQSHVSEGVADAGYNDYGPAFLDPQTNGFGSFERIPTGAAGDSTLARWRAVFYHALRNDWIVVDSLVTRQDSLWNFELVHFQDTEMSREFYLLRERLDSSYVDTNGTSDVSDDVIGSFRRGWGLFVFAPISRLDRAIVQLPHPEDDFLSIPVGLELFLRSEMRVLMIAGAGREVDWDSTHSNYSNTYSISDPTRNERHPFEKLNEVMVAEWNQPPLNPLVVLQLHSYDHASHLPLPDIQLSPWRDDLRPNPPLRDRQSHLDLINALPLYPVQGIDGDSLVVRRVDQYVGLHSSPAYAYYGVPTPLPISSIGDLVGAPINQQASDCHAGHHVDVHTENFVHIEMDEYPDGLWLPPNWPRWLPGQAPFTLAEFNLVMDYYEPLLAAIDSSVTWLESYVDTVAPIECAVYQSTVLSNNDLYVRWTPQAFDRYFDSYELCYDTESITGVSPRKTRTSTGGALLANPSTQVFQLSGLTMPAQNYYVAICAIDLLGNRSVLSSGILPTDSTVLGVTLFMNGDSLELNWWPQLNDSAYKIFSQGLFDSVFVQRGITRNTRFAFSPQDSVYRDSDPILWSVKRVIWR